MSDNPKWKIIQGDALQLLRDFAPGTFDAVITDPPPGGGEEQIHRQEVFQHGGPCAPAL